MKFTASAEAANACIFGDATADSSEHLFSAWMRRAFPQPPGRLPVVRRLNDQVTQHCAHNLAFIEMHGAVCEECNNTWMSGLEKRLKPLLVPLVRGEPVVLTLSDQLDLATWATLKAMVWEVVAEYPSVSTRDDRMSLRNEGRPPAATRVFLGSFEPGNHFEVHHVYVTGFRRPDSAEPDAAAAVTLVLGHAILQVLFGGRESTYRPFERAGPRQPNRVSLWPPTLGDVEVPLIARTTASELDDYARAMFRLASVGQGPPP